MGGFVKFIWGVIGIAVLVHGFFFIKYGTADPCGAAIARLMQDKSPAWIAYGMKTGLGERNLVECYAIAVLGDGALKLPADKAR
jgi:hypothetical protein